LSDIYLITVSGEDKPGVSASLFGGLSAHHARILDIGQAVIHETLSLGILVRVDDPDEWRAASKELLFRAYELDLKIKFQPITSDEYEEWVAEQGKRRYIITLLGEELKTEAVERLSSVVRDQNMNIDVITRLSGRLSLEASGPPAMACAEFSVRGTPRSEPELREALLNIASDLGMDIAVQVDSVYRRNRRLIAFDMDSTLIQAEVIDEMAKEAGTEAEVTAITEAAMRGELDYTESLQRRLALLKGLDEAALQRIADRLPLTQGADRLIGMLKHLGYKIAILSGGFTYFGNVLKKQFEIDYLHANELEIVDGRLTGNVLGPIVDGARKAELLSEIAEQERISLQQTIAVGDGANDLPMLSLAGLGIAYQAKPVVQANARQALNTVGLDGILFLMGFREREAPAVQPLTES
jgi:phosphoserine phosphatase